MGLETLVRVLVLYLPLFFHNPINSILSKARIFPNRGIDSLTVNQEFKPHHLRSFYSHP